MSGLNQPLVIGPVNYTIDIDELEALQKLLDGVFELVVRRVNEHYIDGEQCHSLCVRQNGDFWVLAHNFDLSVDYYLVEEIAGIMRNIFWRPRHIETIQSQEGLIGNLENGCP